MDRVTILKQEIFNEVFTKSAAQGFRPSYLQDKEGTCAYRGTGEWAGCRCNVGHLIPDDRYDATIEGSDLSDPRIFPMTTAYSTAVERGFDEEDVAEISCFLIELQTAHDLAGIEANEAKEHQRRLELVAKEESLTVPALEVAQ